MFLGITVLGSASNASVAPAPEADGDSYLVDLIGSWASGPFNQDPRQDDSNPGGGCFRPSYRDAGFGGESEWESALSGGAQSPRNARSRDAADLASQLPNDLVKPRGLSFPLRPPLDVFEIDVVVARHQDGLPETLAIAPVVVSRQSILHAVGR